MIGILDIGLGNLKSVSSAVHLLGFDPVYIADMSQLDDCTHLWIPGVGRYSTASDRLQAQRRTESIRAFAESGRPVMGTCLGMHLLSTTGDEGGSHPGLDLIPGHVRLLPVQRGERRPHVGWNEVRRKTDHPIFENIKPGTDFYFVHSYHFVTDSEAHVAASPYAGEFTCVAARSNVVGTQFHPEKSQKNGLQMVENFCRWDGRC